MPRARRVPAGRGGAAPALRSAVKRHQRRLHARHRAHGLFGALAHRFPALHRAGIDRDREEHLAVADDHVGQRAGRRQRRAVGARHLGEAVENLLLGRRHLRSTCGCLRPHHRDGAGAGQHASSRLTGQARRRNHLHIGIGASEGRKKEEMMAKVAFLGLGVMGYPMAGHLKTKGGHDVTVYNRTAAKAEKWVAQFGGKRAPTRRKPPPGQDFVMACVGNDNDLREVTLGAGRRLRRHEEGRRVRRPHHRVGRDRARASRRGQEARLRFHRRAGLRRPGRRRERRPHRDVRRRRGALCARRDGHHGLCAHVQAVGRPAPASSPRW